MQSYFQQLAAIIPDISQEAFADICAYEAMLRKWQKNINLIADSTLENLWQRHILDSAQIFPLQYAAGAAAETADRAEPAKIWLDLGSGGGFPALVLACLLKQQNKNIAAGAAAKAAKINVSHETLGEPQKAQIILVESNGKKAAFLRQVIRELALPAQVFQQRIEAIIADISRPDIITARALAPLDKLLALLNPLLAENDGGKNIRAILQKGRGFKQEIAQAQLTYNFDIDIYPSKIDSDSVILLLRNILPRI